MSDPRSFDALAAVVFIVGIYEGLLTFPAKLFDFSPALAFTTRLSSPAWWIVSLAIIAVSIVLLELIDRARKAAAGDSDDAPQPPQPPASTAS